VSNEESKQMVAVERAQK